MCIEVDEELYNCDVDHKYVSDIAGLEKWCDIKTSIVSENTQGILNMYSE